MSYMSAIGYLKRKKKYRDYAAENLNLAIRENEYGEVAPEIKNQIVTATKKKNRLILSAQELLGRATVRIWLLPLAFCVLRWLAYREYYHYEIGATLFIAGIIAFLGIVRYVCLRVLAVDINRVSVGEVVNSKVTLGEDELEYSYSTIDPVRTDGKKYRDINFFVKRIKYTDITSIAYNEKKNCYLIKGSHEMRKYTDYLPEQSNPSYRDETVLIQPLVIFDVYHSRDMFIELALKAKRPIVPDTTDEKRKHARNICILLFSLITIVDAGIYMLLLFYLVFMFA